MDFIWAPWRIEYILGKKEPGCIFCEKSKQNKDAENLILFRGKHNLVIMNLYPYNPGHLMVATYRHVQRLDLLDDAEMLEHYRLVEKCTTVLRDAARADAFNIGMNLGRVAGAGIEDHLHTHIVPRWTGDTNFISVLSDIRAVPEALAATYARLAGRFS